MAFRSNKELKTFTSTVAHLQSDSAKRGAAPIAIIDDRPFAPQTNLQNYGYRINQIGDVKSVTEVAEFPIVLCDIMGVGMHFDDKLQGASIIAEIVKSYPEKIVIAYTGAALNDRAVKTAASRADRIIKKDIDIDEWVEHLDTAVKSAIDPHFVWNRVRTRFVEMDVDTKEILLLEDAYVRSVLSRDRQFGLLAKLAQDPSLRQDTRSIVTGLISSAIFKALFGA
jgi:DNA-binding NarL/FixJ family response regulator